jgi:hypothetical protein
MGRSRVAPYTRANITVPVELKQRMDAVAGVNWSAVAVSAFRRVVEAAETKSTTEPPPQPTPPPPVQFCDFM